MGEQTAIEWCHHTFNPWIGCSKVSAECKNCYAEVETFARVQRARGLELWGKDAARHVTSTANWRNPIAWDRAAREAGERHRVFCASMADIGEDRSDLIDVRFRLARLIEDTPHLDWLLLTKRPENIASLYPWKMDPAARAPWPRNVWLGVTGGTQATFDERVGQLLRIEGPAIRFVSIEPMLERIDLHLQCEEHGSAESYTIDRYVYGDGAFPHPPCEHPHRLDWVIVGGESGPGARRFDVQWAKEIHYACRAAGVAFFLKQLGANVGESNPGASERVYEAWDPFSYRHLKHPKGGDPSEWPHDFWNHWDVRQFPKVLER